MRSQSMGISELQLLCSNWKITATDMKNVPTIRKNERCLRVNCFCSFPPQYNWCRIPLSPLQLTGGWMGKRPDVCGFDLGLGIGMSHAQIHLLPRPYEIQKSQCVILL